MKDYAINPALVNEPTQDQINNSIALLQTGDLQLQPDRAGRSRRGAGQNQPELPFLYTNDGIITDPTTSHYVSDPRRPPGSLDRGLRRLQPDLVGTRSTDVVPDAGTNPVDPTLSADLQLLFNDFAFPGRRRGPSGRVGRRNRRAQPQPRRQGAAMDPSVLDPRFSTDLSTLLASLGTTVGSDAVSAALAEISAQIHRRLCELRSAVSAEPVLSPTVQDPTDRTPRPTAGGPFVVARMRCVTLKAES